MRYCLRNVSAVNIVGDKWGRTSCEIPRILERTLNPDQDLLTTLQRSYTCPNLCSRPKGRVGERFPFAAASLHTDRYPYLVPHRGLFLSWHPGRTPGHLATSLRVSSSSSCSRYLHPVSPDPTFV